MTKFVLCLLLSGVFSSAANGEITITTTIRPLQLIAKAIVEDLGTVTSIVDSKQSPHSIALSPSDRLELDRADLLIWIGPDFEAYLAEFFEQATKTRKVITALQMDDLTIHNFAPDQVDPHLWLDSRNALLIAEEVTNNLIVIDKLNAASYLENLARFRTEISIANLEISEVFSKPTQRQYIVYHNAYQYFEKQFGIMHQFALLTDPEIEPGIREILATRARILQSAPECLLREPDSNVALVATLLDDYELDSVTIDLLGNALPLERNAYLKLLNNVATSIAGCLY